MNRREFLRAIGIGAGALAIDPRQIVSAFPIADVFTGYPPPHFTGFKASMTNTILAGQFLWGVLWEADGQIDVTHWYTQCIVTLDDVHKPDPMAMVRNRVQNAMLSTMMYMDGIVSDVNQRLVEVVVNEPNPDYDPDHAKTHEEDDQCSRCWSWRTTTQKRSVDRAKLIGYDDLYALHGDKSRADRLWEVQYPPVINTVDIETKAVASLLAIGVRLDTSR